MSTESPTYYTVSEFAELLGVDPRSVRRYLKSGLIPGAFKTKPGRGGDWRIPKDSGDKYLAEVGKI